MNTKYYDEFIEILESENKDESLNYVLNLLNEKKITLEELYDELLAPSLTNFGCNLKDKEICIWKEHTRTSIVRTILECTYPYIIERRKTISPIKKKVLLFTPTDEYHEIGAIISTNYFLLAGFEAQYIGANTPKEDIISAVRVLNPDYIAISVTNHYNLVITKKITDELKESFPKVSIILGGQAFYQQNALESIKHDYILYNANEIIDFGKKVAKWN